MSSTAQLVCFLRVPANAAHSGMNRTRNSEKLFGLSSVEVMARHRLRLWQSVEYMIRDYGVVGIGLGPSSFASLYPLYAQVDGASHTQSLYFELILETGILGFVSFMWLALRSIKKCAITRRCASGLTKAVFIGIAFSCIVEYIWFYPRDLFAYFILLGISFAALSIANRNKQEI